uniref:Uncharacterized protein n=1 Tax=Rhizophora mucronata TaxID=61149 RepID=A0A2P2NLI6_RHIMU
MDFEWTRKRIRIGVDGNPFVMISMLLLMGHDHRILSLYVNWLGCKVSSFMLGVMLFFHFIVGYADGRVDLQHLC